MSSKLFDLNDKIVLITGGAGIVGERVSLELSKNGATVIVVDRDEVKAGKVRDMVLSAGGQSESFSIDITKEKEMQQLHDDLHEKYGTVDVLINNAAAKGPDFFEPFESFPIREWEYVMNVNTTGVMLGCKIFGASMAARGNGSIINTLSIYGIVAPDQRIYEGSEYEGKSINTPAVYSTSKAAVWGLTKYLSTYWAEKGVRVNAITPGGIYSGQNDTFQSRYGNKVPLGRMADKDELNGAFVYLASNASSYVTGQNIIVDGGWTAW